MSNYESVYSLKYCVWQISHMTKEIRAVDHVDSLLHSKQKVGHMGIKDVSPLFNLLAD